MRYIFINDIEKQRYVFTRLFHGRNDSILPSRGKTLPEPLSVPFPRIEDTVVQPVFAPLPKLDRSARSIYKVVCAGARCLTIRWSYLKSG